MGRGVPRRRFRRLEVAPPDAERPDGEEPAEVAFRRPLELDGRAPERPGSRHPTVSPDDDSGLELAPRAPRPQGTLAQEPPPPPVQAADPEAVAEATLRAAMAAHPREAGLGSVLSAGLLTACLFAVVSIPVRLAVSAAQDSGLPWRASGELLLVAVITLVLRRVLAGPLQRL